MASGLIVLLLVSMVSSALAQVSATPAASTGAGLLDHEDNINNFVESDPEKIEIPHFNQWGQWTGTFHSIDYWVYAGIVDAILAKGGLPTPRNVDHVYHESGHGRQ